uniref:LAGLIDADG endonuclease family protein n=1 Tax=Rhizoctonia solani TaxID=456999 RepID=N0A332_9AGAM|nr:LAGLIDADG endonuclease family protein [Rhizoctonia solani]AGK45351.1 LAGLIDADG endonuclease family protein [Rhizoctonia solani]
MKNLKNIKTLTPDSLISVLIGILLGDGGIYRTSSTSNCRFEMSFGQHSQQFAEKIGELFKDYMSNPVKSVTLKVRDKTYINYRLKTATLSLFNQYHDMFYNYRQKIVPKNISEFMDPIVLAYLLMSDGNFDKNRNRVRIFANSFTKEEVQILADAINAKLGIYVGVLHDRKDQWILTIGAKQLDLLRQTVSQHFDPSMLYRIGL